MKVVHLRQDSPEWLAWRRCGFGASDAALMVYGKHFDRTYADLIAGMIRKQETVIPSNWAMEQGKKFEPVARRWFEDLFQVRAPALCCENEEHPYIRASLDGWVEERISILEIKYANQEAHREALAGRIPAKYRPQLNHQILAAGSNRVFYLSGNPRFPPLESKTVVFYQAEPAELADLKKRLLISWQAVQDKEPITFAELERRL